MRYFHTLCLVLIAPLAACQSAQNGPLSTPGEQVELASPQLSAVMRSVRPAVRGSGLVQFGAIKASKLAIGQGAEQRQGYAVCGEISLQVRSGENTKIPFVGGFKSNLQEFKLLSIGGSADKSAAVLRACQQAGIVL